MYDFTKLIYVDFNQIWSGKNELLGALYDAINARKLAQDQQWDLLRNSIETKEV